MPYQLRSPFSQEKLRYQSKSQTVISRPTMHPVLKRNFEIVPALDWLAALTAHIAGHPASAWHLVSADYAPESSPGLS